MSQAGTPAAALHTPHTAHGGRAAASTPKSVPRRSSRQPPRRRRYDSRPCLLRLLLLLRPASASTGCCRKLPGSCPLGRTACRSVPSQCRRCRCHPPCGCPRRRRCPGRACGRGDCPRKGGPEGQRRQWGCRYPIWTCAKMETVYVYQELHQGVKRSYNEGCEGVTGSTWAVEDIFL